MPQRVLLIGATGRLGRHFVQALREQGNSVIALVRDQSASADPNRIRLLEQFSRNGVTLVEGDLEDEASLDRACSDADAVVSCIDHRPDHLRLQVNLARAASKSGSVRRILPSQFGIDSGSMATQGSTTAISSESSNRSSQHVGWRSRLSIPTASRASGSEVLVSSGSQSHLAQRSRSMATVSFASAQWPPRMPRAMPSARLLTTGH